MSRGEGRKPSRQFLIPRKNLLVLMKIIKIFQENLRKPLDKLHKMWYNIRAVKENPTDYTFSKKEGKKL